jgi:hypothetical protein
MQFPALPKNANGKIDRPRLKDCFFAAEREPAKLEATSSSSLPSPSSNDQVAPNSVCDSLG